MEMHPMTRNFGLRSDPEERFPGLLLQQTHFGAPRYHKRETTAKASQARE
jgi:hypothetical protein